MGGKRIDRPGSFIEPTILADIEPAIMGIQEFVNKKLIRVASIDSPA
jgi:hypothetical protein